MGLKAIMTPDEFGELDESLKGFYEEKDGKHVLAIDDLDNHPKVSGLRNGHQNSKRERDEAKQRAEALKARFGSLADLDDLDLSDVDAERFQSLLPYIKGEQEIPTGGKGGEGLDLDKIKANARKPLERERDELRARAEQAEGRLQSLVIDNALTQAVGEIKVASPYQKAVRAMFRDKVKVTEGDDGNPVALIEGEYGEQPVQAYLKEWAQTDEGKAFVAAPESGGGGARNTGGGGGRPKNPFTKKLPNGQPNPDFNVTEQGRLAKEQPDVARRMAKEAGWSDSAITW